MSEPIYTPTNCRNPAYQLDWSYSIFWRQYPVTFSWYNELKELNEPDHIRILEHQFQEPNVSQFLVSTTPSVRPILIAQRVKGRLQHLLPKKSSLPFRRNYSLRSLGSTRREKLEQYLATQLKHHPLADARVEKILERFQIFQPTVDLSQPRKTAHALYWYNLHVVLVNEARDREIRDEALTAYHNMIVKAAAAKFPSAKSWLPPSKLGGERWG